MKWVLARCRGEVDAVESPIGYLPKVDDIDINGLGNISKEALVDLLSIDTESWKDEIKDQAAFLDKFDRLPKEIRSQYEALVKRLGV